MARLQDQAPLLRRPFSIHLPIVQDNRIAGIELLYRVVGPCTAMMSQLVKDDRLDLVGPLGQGFAVDKDLSRVYIVAGGIGVAPMVFLARFLMEAGAAPAACSVYIGGKTEVDLLCMDQFSDMGMDVLTATEDGSMGRMAMVTDLLEEEMEAGRPDIVYACGPAGMLQRVAEIAETRSVRCQVSVESMMACGIGACLGCAVESRTEPQYLHACKDGPVFDANMLNFKDIVDV